MAYGFALNTGLELQGMLFQMIYTFPLKCWTVSLAYPYGSHLQKISKSIYDKTLGLGFGSVVFKTVITILWKSDKPVHIVVVF